MQKDILSSYKTEEVEVMPDHIFDVFDVRKKLDEDHLERLELAFAAAVLDGAKAPPLPVVVHWKGLTVYVDGRHRGEAWGRLNGFETPMKVILLKDNLDAVELLALAARLNQQTNQLPMSTAEMQAVIRRFLDQRVSLRRIVGLLESPALPATTIRKIYPEARKVWLAGRLRAAAFALIRDNLTPAVAAKQYEVPLGALQDYMKKRERGQEGRGDGTQLRRGLNRAHKEFKRLRVYIGQAWGWNRGKETVRDNGCEPDDWLTALTKLEKETEQTRKIILDHASKFKVWSEEVRQPPMGLHHG